MSDVPNPAPAAPAPPDPAQLEAQIAADEAQLAADQAKPETVTLRLVSTPGSSFNPGIEGVPPIVPTGTPVPKADLPTVMAQAAQAHLHLTIEED